MKAAPGITLNTSDGAVLSVSSGQDFHASLERILRGSGWDVFKNHTLASSFPSLEDRTISIVICEDNLFPGTWRELLRHVLQMDDPPLLIVAARLADERLWAEALNLGAHDVLATPFDATEVIRMVGIAQQRWRNARALRSGRRKVAMAVGATG
jgi:DNA-binding response OmpR family regulator